VLEETEISNSDSAYEGEGDWLGQDWALIRMNPIYHRPNMYTWFGSSRTTFIDGHLKISELTAGTVSICCVNTVVRGILSGSDASMVIGNSFFTVRSIALEKPLGKRRYALILLV
jgi:hypothetical protein